MVMAGPPAMPTVERVVALSVQPGETIIAECDRSLTVEEAHRLRDDLLSHFPNNKVLILAGVHLRTEDNIGDAGARSATSDRSGNE